MDRNRTRDYVLYAGILGLLAAVLIWPIWLTIRGAFLQDATASTGGWTLYHVFDVFRDPILLLGLFNAFAIAFCTTLLSIIISAPLAWLVARWEFPGKKLLSAFLLVPLILPPFVGAIGIQHLLGRFGSLNAQAVQ